MKYTTKKPLVGVKTWAEDELIDTKNVIVCSTPPKEGEKFTGIGFLIFHNNHIYLVENENGKCIPLRKMPEGWKKLNRNLDKDLICHFIDYGRNHKNYDKYNTYLKHIRLKQIAINTVELVYPFTEVPSLTFLTNNLRTKTARSFQFNQYFMHSEKAPSLLWRSSHYNNAITYFELLLYKNLINEKHLKNCKEFEDHYTFEKKCLKNMIELNKQYWKKRFHIENNEK